VIALLATVVEDLRQFAGFPGGPAGRVLAWLLLGPASVAVAARLAGYERRIGEQGLAAASLWLLRRYYRGIDVSAACAPRGGGLLVVANHPGLGDAMALFGWIARRDITIVTNTRPFFGVMAALKRHTIQVSGDRKGVVQAVRAMVDVLRSGRCLVLFAAGRIEPDLAFEPDAAAPLAPWSDLVGTLVRAASRGGFDFGVLPVHISGVVARSAARSPFVRRAVDRAARDRAAALHTFLRRASRGQRVRLAAGRLLSACVLASARGCDATEAVRAELLAATGRTR
jgi:hypothetical protein